jgi:hypothetical protein
MHYFSNLFWYRTLHVSGRFTVHNQESSTVYTALGVCHTDSFRAGSGSNCISLLILLENCLQTCMTYTIAECTVNNSWWWTEELSETCRISFQNKFEKLVHLVGFIIKKNFNDPSKKNYGADYKIFKYCIQIV